MTHDEQAVVKAALKWWQMHRPIGWTQGAHLDNPTVNCATESEQDLAATVAAWRRFQGPRKTVPRKMRRGPVGASPELSRALGTLLKKDPKDVSPVPQGKDNSWVDDAYLKGIMDHKPRKTQ